MRAGIAVRPFQLPRDVDPLAYLRIVLVFAAEVGRVAQRFCERRSRFRRDPLRQEVDSIQGDFQHTTDILDRRLGRQRAERGDLSDALLAISALDVFDYQLTA